MEASQTETNQIDAATWKAFAEKTIFFGHQSVGYNIIDGVNLIAQAKGFKAANIMEIRDPAQIRKPMLAHDKVGKNRDPQSKLDDFEKIITSGVGRTVEVALLKLCYVDINADSDTEALFQKYKAMLDRLDNQFPQTVFLALTAPLKTVQGGPKAWIKRLLGRTPHGYRENMNRYRFNQQIRQAYGQSGRMFDLARLESTLPGGRRATYTFKGKTFYRLCPEYSRDGGHLNDLGKKWIAAALIKKLAQVSN